MDRLSATKQKELIENYSTGTTPKEAAARLGISVTVVEAFYVRICETIYARLAKEAEELLGSDILVTPCIDDAYSTPIESYLAYKGTNLSWYGGYPQEEIERTAVLFAVLLEEDQFFTVPITDKIRSQYDKELNHKRSGDIVAYHPVLWVHETNQGGTTIPASWWTAGSYEEDKRAAVDAFWKVIVEQSAKYQALNRDEIGTFLKECEFLYKYQDHGERSSILREWLIAK